MECRKERNLKECTCSYPGCPNKGICCECVREHRSRGEIPGCFFSKEDEKTFDRSIKKFIKKCTGLKPRNLVRTF